MIWYLAILANLLAVIGLGFAAFRQSELSYLQLQISVLQKAFAEQRRAQSLHDPMDRLEAAHRRIAETTQELQTIGDRTRHNNKLRLIPGMGLTYIVPAQRRERDLWDQADHAAAVNDELTAERTENDPA